MGTTAATTVVDPSEVNIDAMTYTQSAFGVNFFYLDQILDQMPPISKFIDQTPNSAIWSPSSRPRNPFYYRPHAISALQPIIKPVRGQNTSADPEGRPKHD
jgi:hypothetical protein